MCIRDSVLSSRLRPKPQLARKCSRELSQGHAAQYCSMRRSPRRFEPVSYTHLTLPTICSV
eukprot:3808377-Prorocentrum_lima.AAC.1